MKNDIHWMSASKESGICGSENASSDDNNKVETVNNRIYFILK